MFDFRNTYKNIVVLTGAGISAESGIATFRDSNGLWNNHKVEDVATPLAFRRNPKLVNSFYNQRRQELFKPEIEPNLGHKALAEFENRHKGGFVIITQNVDDLHERAGSKVVLHMHGELLKKRCVKTGRIFSAIDDITKDSICACCNEKGTLRPHIVWFGEMPFDMDKNTKLLDICDLFVSIGTSGHVYPAADFVEIAKRGPEASSANPLAWIRASENPAKTVEINLESTVIGSRFDEGFYGNASEEVPIFFESLNRR